MLRKHKVQSLLLLLIAAVVGGFALVMGGMSFVSFAHAVQTGEAPGLRQRCKRYGTLRRRKCTPRSGAKLRWAEDW